MPTWFKVAFVVMLALGIASMAYSFKKCGVEALAYGNGMLYAAALGVCGK